MPELWKICIHHITILIAATVSDEAINIISFKNSSLYFNCEFFPMHIYIFNYQVVPSFLDFVSSDDCWRWWWWWDEKRVEGFASHFLIKQINFLFFCFCCFNKLFISSRSSFFYREELLREKIKDWKKKVFFSSSSF